MGQDEMAKEDRRCGERKRLWDDSGTELRPVALVVRHMGHEDAQELVLASEGLLEGHIEAVAKLMESW